jgi:hypothetical protein
VEADLVGELALKAIALPVQTLKITAMKPVTGGAHRLRLRRPAQRWTTALSGAPDA